MRKKLCIAFAVLMGLTVIGCNRENIDTTTVAGTEESSKPAETTTEAPEEPFRVCVVVNVEDEQKENVEQFIQGAEATAENLDIQLEICYGKDQDEWSAEIEGACEDGIDLVVGTDPEIADSIAIYAPEYPEVRFAILEAEVYEPNVRSYYLEYEAAFYQAGMAAASFVNERKAEEMTRAEEPNSTREEVVAWIGGMNIPVIRGYFEAYEDGVQAVNPDIQVLEAYVGSWADAEKGKEVAAELVGQGAEVIAFVAADSESGIMEVVKEYGVYTIGMTQFADAEGAEQTLGIVGEDMACIAEQMIKDGVQEDFAGGTIRTLTLEDGMVLFSEQM